MAMSKARRGVRSGTAEARLILRHGIRHPVEATCSGAHHGAPALPGERAAVRLTRHSGAASGVGSIPLLASEVLVDDRRGNLVEVSAEVALGDLNVVLCRNG